MFNYKYSQSQLVTAEFNGCNLGDIFYRINNIQKLNHLLCHAYDNDYNIHLFEILDQAEELSNELHQLKLHNSFYAKLDFDEKVLLAIFTKKGKDFSVGMVDSCSSDYTMLADYDLSSDEIDIEEVAFNVYQLAQHTTLKNGRKDKGFSGSDLTKEIKQQELILVKSPKIIHTT